jgi:uncharacterized membrane protein
MATQLILSSDKNRVTVSPGAQADLSVTIKNLTTLVDDASITVSGIDKSWVQVVPPHVPVFAQGEAIVRVLFQPPADPLNTLAGIYPLTIGGLLQEQDGEQADTKVDLEIQFGGDYRIELGKSSSVNNQEAVFPFKVRNDANAPLNIRCSGEDPQNSFWYKFDPFQFTVPPGSETTSRLSIRARQPAQDNRKIVFTLKTQGEWTITGMSSIEASQKQVNGQWEQGAQPNLMVSINPPSIEDSNSGNYQLVVNNPGLTTETVVLEGSTANGQLGFRFNPAQLALKPQSQGIVTLTVWPITANAAGQTAIDFWVTAKSGSGKSKPGSTRATFVHLVAAGSERRPRWLIPVIVLVVCLMIICAISLLVILNFNNSSSPYPAGSTLHSFDLTQFFARSILNGSICNYFS